MRLIELHIVQSFPVTCLNRDDVGAPKTAYFGGCQRARVSSQCWKRAVRDYAVKEVKDVSFGGKRGHYFAELLETSLKKENINEDKAKAAAATIIEYLGKHDTKKKNAFRSSVSLFMSPLEIDTIAKTIAEKLNNNEKIEPKKGSLKEVLSNAMPKDIADIAIFGRMVADDHTLMLEGAGLFSHAISTHQVANDIDFFSAVDDLKPEDTEGAGHIGTLEFNSACYYRYVGLNLDLLQDEDHLNHLSEEERNNVIKTFVKSSILAVPSARKNSMFGFNPPEYVLAFKRTGQPLSLVNAFETAVKARDGYVQASVDKLKQKWESLRNLYNLDEGIKAELPPDNLDGLIKKLL